MKASWDLFQFLDVNPSFHFSSRDRVQVDFCPDQVQGTADALLRCDLNRALQPDGFEGLFHWVVGYSVVDESCETVDEGGQGCWLGPS
jgi:hypothetical protein